MYLLLKYYLNLDKTILNYLCLYVDKYLVVSNTVYLKYVSM